MNPPSNISDMRHIILTLLLAFAAIIAMADNTVPVCSIEYEKEQQYGSSRVSVEFPLGEDSPLRMVKPFLTEEVLRLVF